MQTATVGSTALGVNRIIEHLDEPISMATPQEMRGIYFTFFNEESYDLSKVSTRDFETKLMGFAINPSQKMLIISFYNCYFNDREKMPLIAGILARASRAMELRGKKLSICHIPESLYKYLNNAQHPLLQRLDMHGQLQDAIQVAIDRQANPSPLPVYN